MDKKKSIDVLNDLIEINNDRVEGYNTAAKETTAADLKLLFGLLSQTSQKCNAELVKEVLKLGAEPVEGTKTTGKFFRAWMDVKAAITGNDRKAILNSCEFGEDEAVNTYRKAMKESSEYLSSEQQTMINQQYSLIKADHDKIRSLRDAA